jgi:hypothetical protein
MTLILTTERGFVAGDPVHVAITFIVAFGLVGGALLWARGGLHSAEQAA